MSVSNALHWLYYIVLKGAEEKKSQWTEQAVFEQHTKEFSAWHHTLAVFKWLKGQEIYEE